MTLLGLALAALLAGGGGSLIAASHARWATRIGVGGAVLGSALGILPALRVLSGTDLPSVHLAWSIPGGAISLGIDALSAFFLVPIFGLGAATALYGAAYLRPEADHKLLGVAWFWFDLLLASMALVATARNGLLFLVAWETMALSSFFLVVFHHERDGVPRAGWVYLVATHVGTAFLLVLFAWLAWEAGSFDLSQWTRPDTGASWLFALALIGFGSKAGLFPFHVWLPEAHPVAPSHVSALLSGVMVKLGIYGLLRTVVVLGPPDPVWGALLLIVGLASALFGGLTVLVQRDLKKCLAYSTVENLGIVALALGLGLLVSESTMAPVAVLALAGGLLHVWNHALFKSLLFLAAGSVGRATGTLDVESMGGLLRRMPWTGMGLLVGGAAICALPPFNGFVGEFLIYLAAFQVVSSHAPTTAAAVSVIAGLGFVGALAAAGFVRVLGIALLGESRTAEAAQAVEGSLAMRGTLIALSVACLLLGVGGASALAASSGPVGQVLATSAPDLGLLRDGADLLWSVGALGGTFGATVLVLVLLRRRFLPGPVAGTVETWDCGYAAPGPRMQYSASSFAEPLTRLFAVVLGVRVSEVQLSGIFPRPEALASRSADLAEALYTRVFSWIASLALRLRPLEVGNTQLYVLYTCLAALALLAWGLL
jgi:formate hydrogenlyase subunit 3/multisubunit Na+/H+ antiporter MnhD subunit